MTNVYPNAAYDIARITTVPDVIQSEGVRRFETRARCRRQKSAVGGHGARLLKQRRHLHAVAPRRDDGSRKEGDDGLENRKDAWIDGLAR